MGSRRVVALAGGVAVLIGAAVAVAAWPQGRSQPVRPGQSVTTWQAVPSAGSAGPATPAPVSLDRLTLDDVTWQLVGQVAVPVSRAAGPTRVTGGTASGYARTPAGALVAAAQLTTRAGLSAGRDSWEPTVTEQFVPSRDRDLLLAALRAAGDQAAGVGELSQIVGYQYQAYTPDVAVVGLVYRAPGRETASHHILVTTLWWRDGDWRMTAPAGGTWTSASRPAPDLTAVTPWGVR